MDKNRRTFLKVLGSAGAAAAVGSPMMEALAGPALGENEFFLFIHCAGAWDVTLGLDPRNERRGLIEPGSTEVCDTATMRRWRDAPLDADSQTFAIVQPSGSNIRFGPAVGNLADLFDRITVVNGLAVNTVSHPDGTVFAATGRHLAGGKAPASSVDTVLANEFGREKLFPVVSVSYPSYFVPDVNAGLDRRVAPLRMSTIDTVSRSLTRSTAYDLAADRDLVSVLLTQEARDLAARQAQPEVLQGFALQFESLRTMLRSNIQDVFSAAALQTAYPSFNYRARFQGRNAVNAAFAIEAMERNLVKCAAFTFGSFDTHGTNYRTQGLVQQEAFDTLVEMVRILDRTPHPTLRSERLGGHTHILVTSDFCRTPQINISGGRDHYPNGSSLIISPRFRANRVFGQSDPDQLLPVAGTMFTGGMRPIAPPDVLATLLHAFGVNPRRYMRDGEPVREMLRM